MTQLLDCLIGYFGLDEADQPTCRRYYSYHVVAGPGPTAGGGMASITTLAIYDESERCNTCQHFHVVDTGGPAAALEAAIRYLDTYHQHAHLRRVQSDIRGLDSGGPSLVRNSLGVSNGRNHSRDAGSVRGGLIGFGSGCTGR